MSSPMDDLLEERLINGHHLSLREVEWRCLDCGHWFDAAADARLFRCGESCRGRHPGDPGLEPPAPPDQETDR